MVIPSTRHVTPMLLSPLAAVALQVPLLAVGAAALLRGQPIVRWLRLLLLGLGWLLLEALVQPLVVTDTGPLADVPVVPALVVAGMIVALIAAGIEARDATASRVPPLLALLALTLVFLVVPPGPGLGIALLGWVVGTLRLGWVLWAGARAHRGSLLAARLRMLAAASALLASAALSTFGGPFLFVWALPMVTGTAIVAAAVALPPAIRIVPHRTREALREVDTEIVAIGSGDVVGPAALRAMVEHVRQLFGAEAVVLTDGDRRVATAGGATPVAADPDDPQHLTVSTGRGELTLVLPPIGLLLSRSDREQACALAERMGLVLTRDDARRADARASAAREAADRVRDDVVSTLSHELRTPLTAIMGFAEVLRRHGGRLDPDDHQLLLERIADRSQHLEQLVAALLDLTAVRGRGAAGVGEQRELAELLDLAIHRSGRADQVDTSLPARRVTMQTDVRAVVEVVEELVRNATKFSPAGSRVEVRADVHGDDVLIEVHDRGPGFGDLGLRAFEPFTRGGHVLTRETGGLGIGLTIARELARQLGGTLTAVDTATGACLQFVLPRRHAFAAIPVPARPHPVVTAA